MIKYNAGLIESFIISGIIATLIIISNNKILTKFKDKKIKEQIEKYEGTKNDNEIYNYLIHIKVYFITIIVGIFLFIVTLIVTFIGIFPIINLIEQIPIKQLNSLEYIQLKNIFLNLYNYIGLEISNGIIQLRICSIIVVYQIIKSCIQISYINKTQKEIKIEIKALKFKIDLFNFTLIDKFLERNDKKSTISLITIHIYQLMLYTFIIISLWLIVLEGEKSILFNINAFLLFFIIDDWAIISEYEIDLEGKIIDNHIIKIIIFNFLLLIISSILITGTKILNEYSYIFIVFMWLTLFVILNQRYKLYSERTNVNNKEKDIERLSKKHNIPIKETSKLKKLSEEYNISIKKMKELKDKIIGNNIQNH